MTTITSANYLPAGCKRVKLNLANAYRTTITHLVPGDVVRVESSVHSPLIAPAATKAANKSFWATVSKVERGTGWVAVTVESSWYTGALRWTVPHTAITRKERAEEYSARLMLAEQEREASLKATAPVPEAPVRPAARRPVSVHDPKFDAAGLCAVVVDRPSGIPTICSEPVKSAIHDPAAYSAYHTELLLELKGWSAPASGADLDRILDSAFPIPSPRPVPVEETIPLDKVMARSGARVHLRASSVSALTTLCGLDVSGLANGYDGPPCSNCDQVTVPAPKFPTRQELRDRAEKAEATLATVRSTMLALKNQGEANLSNSADAVLNAQVNLLDVLIRLLDS